MEGAIDKNREEVSSTFRCLPIDFSSKSHVFSNLSARFGAHHALELLDSLWDDEIEDGSEFEDEISDRDEDTVTYENVYNTFVHRNGGVRVRQDPAFIDSVLHTAGDLHADERVC